MTTAIRLSPSGPVIANGAGGPFTPGAGARLRLSEATSTISATGNTIPTAPATIGFTLGNAPTTTVVALPNPSADLYYRATVSCDVENPSTNVLGEVQLYLEYSVDGGTTFNEWASNTHIVNSTEVAPAAPQSRNVSLTKTLTLGSALAVPITDGSHPFVVRAKIGASSGGNTLLLLSPVTPGGDNFSQGTIYLAVEECF